MTGLAMSKPWTALTDAAIAALPAQLGVFEIADSDRQVTFIGYAGGRDAFGLRTALTEVLTGDRPVAEGALADPAVFRVELTHGYLTRWEELLMVHHARHGRLPEGNALHPFPLGRLTVEDR